jgi:triosephosphate isomerase
MARREIFAGNWKMFTTHDEAVSLAKGIVQGMGDMGSREVVLFPPSPHLREVVQICRGTPAAVGAQNMYFEKEGAFTGEISPLMVKDAGARYVLVGHSERRHVFGETDEDARRKVLAALETGLLPMLCVGELLADRDADRSEEVVKLQLETALGNLSSGQVGNVVIAYEPVWAIGTGKVATPEIAESMHRYIRELLTDLFGEDVAQEMPILYGGSVKADNIAGLYRMENIDGALVGGASLKIQSFLDIINVTQ